MTEFTWHKFSDLSPETLYELLALRADIFVVEQNCAYQDLDGKDQAALHLLGRDENKIVAYLRLFPPHHPQNPLIFGRVLTARNFRSRGVGRLLMKEMLNYCEKNFPNIPIHCSAQYYLKEFYESFGFNAYGEMYDDNNIPHIMMSRE